MPLGVVKKLCAMEMCNSHYSLIWHERNRRIFEDFKQVNKLLWDRVRLTAQLSASIIKKFQYSSFFFILSKFWKGSRVLLYYISNIN